MVKDRDGKEYTEEEAIAVIPKDTPYCYNRMKEAPSKENGYSCVWDYCPFFDIKKDKPKQDNGYCHFMEEGDWECEGLSLLWDACKECGISCDYENDITEGDE